MNPNQPRHRGWRTKEQARKRKHDVPVPPIPPIEPEVVILPNPMPPNPIPEDIIILTDSDTSEIQPSPSSQTQTKGKGVASDASSSPVTSSPSDGDYVPPPSFEYNEEVQSEYAARKIRRMKGKGVASSSEPTKANGHSVLPKPKPQVLGLVCERAYVNISKKGRQSLPSTKDLQFLSRNDLSDRCP